MRKTQLLACGFVLAASLFVAAQPASATDASVIVVEPGESIQAAVDAANPGDTIQVEPGTYQEHVNVYKDSLTLIGDHAVLTAPIGQHIDSNCSGSGRHAREGFCIAKGPDPSVGITRVRVSGFTVEGFEEMGIMTLFGNRVVIDHNTAIGNGEYGIVSFVSQRMTYRANHAEGSGEAGLYIGDTVGGGNLITGNTATGNGLFGIFVRDASGGVVTGNTMRGNCSGLMFLDTGSGGAGNNFNWTATGNVIDANNNACIDEPPPLSGAGVVLLGAQSITVENNTITRQAPNGESIVAGGVVLVDATDFGGGTATGNTIQNNVIRNNEPYDIDASGTTGVNTFTGNLCGKSNPAGLC
jgi:parallel beta-helix repeat protein